MLPKFVLLIFYNLALPYVFMVSLPVYLRRMVKRGNFSRNFEQRFSLPRRSTRLRIQARDDWDWVRAVSVGEMMGAEKLVRELKRQDPGYACVISTTTSTGFAVAEKQFADALGDWVELIYSPLDFAGLAWRGLRVIRPRRILFMESEIWPNLLMLAHARGTRLAVINARMSPRSESRFRRYGPWGRRLFELLDLVTIQEEAHRSVWEQMGVAPEKIHLTGALKLDFENENENGKLAATARDLRQMLEDALGWRRDAPVLLGGSTAPGEEEILRDVYLSAKRACPDLKLILAPRHVERCPEILAKLRGNGSKNAGDDEPAPRVARRTELGARGKKSPGGEQVDVLLLDTTGELAQWYSVACLVFIGKSLTVGGGQNPVEALAAGKPVMFGPLMANQKWIAEKLLRAGAAREVRDADHLAEETVELLRNETRRREMVRSGQSLLRECRGAAENNARLVLGLLA
jgi:3-deoxy-D-manno-octulosonic-acid transferase